MNDVYTKELIGRTVMVNPLLTTDPVAKQGECGKVIAVLPAKNTLLVRFADHIKGEYEPECLLTLLPAKTIKRNWLKSSHRLNGAANSRLSKIFLMTSRKEHEGALQLATESIAAQGFATLDCKEWAEKRGQTRSHKQRHQKRF